MNSDDLEYVAILTVMTLGRVVVVLHGSLLYLRCPHRFERTSHKGLLNVHIP